MIDFPSGTTNQNKLFLPKVTFGHGVFSQQQKITDVSSGCDLEPSWISACYIGISVSLWCFSFSLPHSWQFAFWRLNPTTIPYHLDGSCLYALLLWPWREEIPEGHCIQTGKVVTDVQLAGEVSHCWEHCPHCSLVHTGEQLWFSLIWNFTQCISCKTISNSKNSTWFYRLLLGSGRRLSLLTFLFLEMRD